MWDGLGNNTLLGGIGYDTLIGSDGINDLHSGEERDTFAYGEGRMNVRGFEIKKRQGIAGRH